MNEWLLIGIIGAVMVAAFGGASFIMRNILRSGAGNKKDDKS